MQQSKSFLLPAEFLEFERRSLEKHQFYKGQVYDMAGNKVDDKKFYLYAMLQAKTLMSQEEFLQFERNSQEKHEYYKGEIFAMSGASYEHNVIEDNIRGELHNFLKGKQCRSFGSNLRVSVKANTLYTYPDIIVICGKPEFQDDQFDTVVNPALIIEILSPSTANYDKGTKFELYRDISSLREYLTIDSTKLHIEQFIKNSNNTWTLQEFKNFSDSFTLATIKMPVVVSDWYAEIKFGH
jgi:Uma2 family endonuclease